MERQVPAEQDLIQRCRRFEHQALEQVYDTHAPAIQRYALRLLGDQMLSEDCTAETFSRFLQALRTGRGPRDHLQAYLFRVAHNWIVDHYRHPLGPSELTEEIQADVDDPEEEAVQKEHRNRLRQALFRLTPDQQQVIALKYLEGWENEAIARALGKPVGAVKSLQHRALKTLERFLTSKD